MWPFISYLVMAQPLPSSCFYGAFAATEFLSTGEKPFSLGAHLSPASLTKAVFALSKCLHTKVGSSMVQKKLR